MKEKTLNTAIEIKKRLDNAREIMNNIKEKRELTTGNYSEVMVRKFELNIYDGNNIRKIWISSNAAESALDIDLKNSSNTVSLIENELESLD